MAAQLIAAFQGVSKRFDGTTDAVGNLDLAVAPGEFLVLLGPAGAGKSTILAMLAGFAAPTHGEIRLDGRVMNRTPPDRRGLGLVVRSHALLPHLTVAENVTLPLAVRGLARAERARLVANALGLARLTGKDGLLPAALTTAENFRVALARALVFSPKLILLDDPLGALAAAERAEIMFELRRLQRHVGVAMLYATRDPAEAMVLASRIAVLRHGVLHQLGTPDELYAAPADAFVAGFVGENNALAGRIEAVDEDIAHIRLRAGPLVTGRIADAGAPGDRCMLFIRPERIALAAVEAIQLGENALAAVVEEIIPMGDHLRVRLMIGADTDLVVKRPVAAGRTGLAAGRPAALAWQAEHGLVFRVDR